ncbi:MAG: PTS sugar transporter subunit IIC [Erysipelotrichaceae bacterium]|nr:PTS sugar transporter subunit IIC [Erysipelotrichaceae bacterium]
MSTLDKITNKIMKFAQLRYVKIIMNAFMSVAAFSIGASLFSLLRSIPIPFWQEFLTNTGLTNILNIPITMVSNLYAIMIVICVGYEVAISFDAKPLPAAMIAFGSFMILTPFEASVALQVDGEVVRGVAQNVIGVGPLGSQGIFLAMFAGILGARLYVFLVQKNIKLKMPETLPPAVAGMFETMIPAGLVFIVFIIIRLLFGLTPYGTAQNFIYGVLQAPLVGIGATPVGAALYLIASEVLWMFGVHGGLIAYAALGSVRSAATQANMAAFAAGEPVPYLEWTLLTPFSNMHMVALVILLVLSKSEQFKSLGKLALPTTIFNINEPLMFGLPIILNPIWAVPFVLLPGVNVFVTALLMKAGILASSTGVALASNIPGPIYLWMCTNSISGLIWGIILVVLNGVVWFPFFKAAEKQALKQEAELEADQAA